MLYKGDAFFLTLQLSKLETAQVVELVDTHV